MKLFLDYETYYDIASGYTLKKMTPAEYILDKRFQVHGCAVQEGIDTAGWWCDGDDLPRYFKSIDPKTTIAFTFNALFDMCITEWIYGFDPFLMIDVLGMSRALRGHLFKNHSLATVGKMLGLPPKLNTITKVNGMRTEQIKAQPELWEELKAYSIVDNSICAGVANTMLPEFPHSEMRVMDLVLRCCVQPMFRLNRKRVVMLRRKLRQNKAKLIADAGSDKINLMSAAKFKALLESQGVAVWLKVSPKGKMIPALAKTDQFMADLLEHPDSRLQALAAARLGIRSTLEESRAKRFSALATLPAAIGYPAGSAPVALRYGAAHTHRLGGEWKLNFQNLVRGSELRYAIEAWREEEWVVKGYDLMEWPGDVVLAPDYSQIEARMVAYLAGQKNLLEMFGTPKTDPRYDPFLHDPYNVLAAQIFGRPINRKLKSDELEGFIGKTGILGLGYGAGKDKFHTMVHQLARVQLGHDVPFTQEQANNAVDTYRRTLFTRIPQLWKTFDYIVADLAVCPRNDIWQAQFPMLEFEHEAIILPNGMKLRYHNLRKNESNQWVYTYGRETRTIYGAKCVENVSQALTRIIAMNAALRLNDRGIRLGLQAHDELVLATRKDTLPQTKQIILDEMLRCPSWAPGFPLAIEIKHGPTYGDAK